MLEVTVQLGVSLMLKSRIVQSAKGIRDLKMPTVPRKGETLLIEYSYNDDDGNTIEGHLTPTVRGVSYVFQWEDKAMTAILLDCEVMGAFCKDQVMFDKAIEIWRGAEFDVTVKEAEDDF